MTDSIDKTNRTPLDDQLDTALAKYAAVEPRAGLEQRILANLEVQPRPTAAFAWRRWAGALAAALLIAILLVWRLEKHGPQQIVRRAADPHPQAEPQVSAKSAPAQRDQPAIRVAVPRPRKHAPPATALASAEPKLDQFPSPRPLSPEELALAQYARDFPKEALLTARTQEELQTELQKQRTEAVAQTEPSGSDQQDR